MNNFNQSNSLKTPEDVMIGRDTLQSVIDSHSRWLEDGRGCRARLSGVDLSDVNLSGADLSRAELNGANLTGADLSGANLGGADLIWADLSGSNLSRADLSGSNMSRADLSGSNLIGADLKGTNLSNTNLSKANLTNIKLDKSLNLDSYKIPNLDQKVADLVGNGENLDMDLYHSKCGTRHCRAGYAILAAEAAGKNLEDKIGTSAAAALIYHASTGRVPNFYASKEDALANIRKCAEK